MLEHMENSTPLPCFQTKNNSKVLRSVSTLHGDTKATHNWTVTCNTCNTQKCNFATCNRESAQKIPPGSFPPKKSAIQAVKHQYYRPQNTLSEMPSKKKARTQNIKKAGQGTETQSHRIILKYPWKCGSKGEAHSWNKMLIKSSIPKASTMTGY